MNVSVTGAGVVLISTPRVPLKARPGTSRATVPEMRPARPAWVSRRVAVPSVTLMTGVAPPRVRVAEVTVIRTTEESAAGPVPPGTPLLP